MLTAVSPDQWDTFLNSQPRAHILQQAAWGDLKSAYGWSVERVALTDDSQSQIICGAQLLFRPLPFHLGTMAYLPMGPFPPLHRMERGSGGEVNLWQSIHTAAKKLSRVNSWLLSR